MYLINKVKTYATNYKYLKMDIINADTVKIHNLGERCSKSEFAVLPSPLPMAFSATCLYLCLLL